MNTRSRALEKDTRRAIVYNLARDYAKLPETFLIDILAKGQVTNLAKVEDELLVAEFEFHCIDWDFPEDHHNWVLLEEAKVQLQVHRMLTEKQG